MKKGNLVWIFGGGALLLFLLSRSKTVVDAAKRVEAATEKFAFSVRDPTDKTIQSLASRLQPIAIEFVRRARAAGFPVVLVSGTRSIEEQNALYAQGRTKSGGIVTNAKGGESAHNFGLAFDFAFGDVLGNPTWPENGPWSQVAEIGKQLGLEWGGDWGSFRDRPHLETADWRQVRGAWKNSGARAYAVV